MRTIPELHAAWLTLERRVSAIEQRQMRFMRQWIASHLTSSISGPTGRTSRISMDTTANGPMTGSVSIRSPKLRASIWRRVGRRIPKVLGWLAEKLLSYLLPSLIAAGWSLWKWGMDLWHLLAGWWHLVVG